mmetsp:Transcript_6582/g.15700  ORF Transcript_6582/g.15700 Transcript_6582/m.15700 type:complete len:599 (-) Transcript_6582:87-1883(-)
MVRHPPRVPQVRVLRPHPGVVQPGRNGVGLHDLPVIILQQVGHRPVQHPLGPGREGGGVLRGPCAVRAGRAGVTTGLHANNLHVLIIQEIREHPDSIASSPHTRHQHVRQAPGPVGEPLLVQHLGPRLPADHGLEILHDGGEGVGTHGAADDVVGGNDVGHPVAHGLIDGILQGLRPALHRHHLGPQHLHPEHVQLLPLHVHRAHVHDALHPQQRAGRGRGDPVLAGPGLSNDAALPNLLGQESLSHRVVDLMGASVGQLLTLEPDLGPSDLLREPLRVVQRGGPSDELLPQARHLSIELRVNLALVIHFLQLLVCLHESLRDKPASKPGGVLPLVAGPHVDLRPLRRRLGASAVALAPLGELADKCPHLRDPLLQGGNNGRAHHHAVGARRDLPHMLLSGHPEPHDTRHAVGLVLESLHDGRYGAAHVSPLTGHPRDAGDVDEAGRHGRQALDPLRGAGGGDHGHDAQIMGVAVVQELAGLLGGQVHNNEPVRAGRRTLLADPLQAMGQEVVVVPHENDRHRHPLRPRFLHQLQAPPQVHPLLQRLLRGLLDGGPVGHGVREWDSQFDDVGSRRLELQHGGDGVSGLGASRGDEGHE